MVLHIYSYNLHISTMTSPNNIAYTLLRMCRSAEIHQCNRTSFPLVALAKPDRHDRSTCVWFLIPNFMSAVYVLYKKMRLYRFIKVTSITSILVVNLMVLIKDVDQKTGRQNWSTFQIFSMQCQWPQLVVTG